MTNHLSGDQPSTGFLSLIKNAILGKDIDYTQGSVKRAVVLLAIPMMLEMSMESVFALVDLYFVGHLENSSAAIQTVGLTESVLTIIYSIAIGMSMAATAVVSRRIGEKNPEAASKAGMQAILIAIIITLAFSIPGMIFAGDILRLMGASPETVAAGIPFVRIMMGSSSIIMLLFLINGIFRGAGNASVAMYSMMVANVLNIILCPVFINGFAFIPAYGLTGAAIATTIGRGVGVLFLIGHLVYGNHRIKIKLPHLQPDWVQIKALTAIAGPAVLQFVIASCSWIFLAEMVAVTGGDIGSSGYQTALRLMMFFMLPAWGLSNAASTLVGQNLGANQVNRAQQSVMTTIAINVSFMALVTLIFFFLGDWLVGFFTTDEAIKQMAQTAMRYMSIAFVFYGAGMVLMNAFNGAGDTRTPSWLNFFGFWCFQLPLAYLLTYILGFKEKGVFIAIPVAETAITIAAFILFKRGRWKKVKV